MTSSQDAAWNANAKKRRARILPVCLLEHEENEDRREATAPPPTFAYLWLHIIFTCHSISSIMSRKQDFPKKRRSGVTLQNNAQSPKNASQSELKKPPPPSPPPPPAPAPPSAPCQGSLSPPQTSWPESCSPKPDCGDWESYGCCP